MIPKKLLTRGLEWEPERVESNLSDHMALAVSILLPILFFILVKAISH